jgi:hypothetical protein
MDRQKIRSSSTQDGTMVRRQGDNVSQNAVFLNIPYDKNFRSLYMAYIAGLVHLGFVPRVTLGLPGGARRLDKILAEIQGCRYSIHDLSRVGLDRNPPFSTPRFNMPFELGVAVAWEKLNPKKHTWFIFETKIYRVQKSLSDLNGTDPQIHGGQVSGIMRELSNIFRRPRNQPTVPEMMSTFSTISRKSAKILEEAGTKSLFEARAFKDLCYEAKVAAESQRLLTSPPGTPP